MRHTIQFSFGERGLIFSNSLNEIFLDTLVKAFNYIKSFLQLLSAPTHLNQVSIYLISIFQKIL